ncbi:bifunctional sulfate adenylyltransferase/adenylylsulfate kinase [Paracoccus onubensis]|uniref:ATP-sulfurylase PUA-like domain-containing protein n=1 Tax=Paracoccus onubensis TaxID=1675788 RepID=A0A418SWT4_9RHOB|nr:hypothetical protein [Paracoccus onubensis]RJE85348.1 hypothetical protein D3P04_10030 [Paracoccus onubensis]
MTPLNQIPIPELFVSPEAAEKLTEEGTKLPRWVLSEQQASDLELLMNGGFFPLRGFMTQADCDTVTRDGSLTSGAVWPLPVTLDVDEDFAGRIEPGDDIALSDGPDLLAIMSVTDHWQSDGVTHLGGKVKGLRPPAKAGDTPNQLRRMFRQTGWEDVTALYNGDGLADIQGPAMLILPVADQVEDRAAPFIRDNIYIARIRLFARAENEAMVALREIVGRNHGATRVHS